MQLTRTKVSDVSQRMNNLLAGGTLDIGQNSEVIPHTSKACQDLDT